MPYVDVKVTIWRRAQFTDDTDVNELVAIIQQQDLNAIYTDEMGFISYKTIDETEEFLPTVENGGQATIEVYQSEVQLIWTNA
jgi:hypothetical protein